MNKEKLEKFIDKYSLNGEIDSVMLKSTGDELSVDIIADDKALLGSVVVSDVKFPTGEFGIYTTSQLKNMLSVLNNDISIEVHTDSKSNKVDGLLFSDNNTKVQYMLAEQAVIPKVPDLKTLPEFNINIKVDNDFITTFGKSKSALKDTKTFTFMSKGGENKIVLGYSSINSNRISLNVNAEVDKDIDPISFNSDYLKSILDANKGSSDSLLEISTDGLCRVQFTDGDFKSKYYIVESK